MTDFNPAAPDRTTVSAICRLLHEEVGLYTIGVNYAAIGDWMWKFWTPIQDMEPEHVRLWQEAVIAAITDGDWDEEAVESLRAERDEARRVALLCRSMLAQLCRSMLAQMPVFLDELFGEDEWEQLPEWFKDGNDD